MQFKECHISNPQKTLLQGLLNFQKIGFSCQPEIHRFWNGCNKKQVYFRMVSNARTRRLPKRYMYMLQTFI